jgi:hypothetical protein
MLHRQQHAVIVGKRILKNTPELPRRAPRDRLRTQRFWQNPWLWTAWIGMEVNEWKPNSQNYADQGWIGPGTLRNVVPVKFLTTGTRFRYSLGPFMIFFLSQRTPLEVEQIFRMSGELGESCISSFPYSRNNLSLCAFRPVPVRSNVIFTYLLMHIYGALFDWANKY